MTLGHILAKISKSWLINMSSDAVSKSMPTKRGSKWAVRVYKKKNKYAKDKDLKAVIKKELESQAENKVIEGTVTGAAFYQVLSASQNVWSIIPNITQGNTQGTRIGNQVKIKKLTLRMSITVNNQSTIYTPAYVDVYIFKYKPANYYPTASLPGTSMLNFLQAGSTSTQYTGLQLDGLRDVNKDVYTLCYKKRLLLYNPLNGTGVQASTGTIQPNYSSSWDLTKYVRKTLHYDDSTSYVTNDNLWIGIGSSQLDGVLIPVVQIGTISFASICEYEDM